MILSCIGMLFSRGWIIPELKYGFLQSGDLQSFKGEKRMESYIYDIHFAEIPWILKRLCKVLSL